MIGLTNVSESSRGWENGHEQNFKVKAVSQHGNLCRLISHPVSALISQFKPIMYRSLGFEKLHQWSCLLAQEESQEPAARRNFFFFKINFQLKQQGASV